MTIFQGDVKVTLVTSMTAVCGAFIAQTNAYTCIQPY